MSPVNDERTLISKAVEGDLASLEMLLYRHHRSLSAYMRSHFPKELRDWLEPEDILQDVWLKAIGAVSGFRAEGPDPVFRWLVTIARHQIADHLKYIRTSKRKNTRHLLDKNCDDASIARLLAEMAVYLRTPSKSAVNHELMVALDSAIGRLPRDQARALKLRHLTGLDVPEVARQMNRTRASAANLCSRALKSLRWEMRSISLYM
jgi:RNA polymerase sigma-70 factor, ECF subfamily